MAAKLSGPSGGRYDVGQNNEINVTPFVDVMLVLLIIFTLARGAATMKMIRSTSITSTKGVTLIDAFWSTS